MSRDADVRLQDDVLAYLVAKCRGKAARATRSQLVAAMRSAGHLRGLSDAVADRKVRGAIEANRRRHKLGALICSSSSGLGYWIAASASELEAFLAEDERRGRSILGRASMQRARALEALKALPYEQGRLL